MRVLSEVRQMEKDKYHAIALIMWNIKKLINKPNSPQRKSNRNKHVDTENRVVVVGGVQRGSTSWRWMEGKFLVVSTLYGVQK